MANLFDYLLWRGDLSFRESPFNPVDNVIFSQLAYLTFDGIIPSPEEKTAINLSLAVRIFREKLNANVIKSTSGFKEDPDFIKAIISSKRFSGCELFGFINHFDTELEIQFSAFCVSTNDGCTSIIFRGTDSSLVGWKEDFNMCFMDVIPSQLIAVNYLEKMARCIRGSLRIGGHSKGGNLAIYAAAHCKKNIQKRIKNIYSNDAPGFNEKVTSGAGYKAIKDKIKSFVPQSSIIGMFLQEGNYFTVIHSSESGLMQHCQYSWEVTHNNLVLAEKSTPSSRFVNNIIREWIDTHDKDDKEKFIEALYYVLKEADVKSTIELEKTWFTSIGRVMKSLNGMEETSKKFMKKTFLELFRSAGNNIKDFM